MSMHGTKVSISKVGCGRLSFIECVDSDFTLARMTGAYSDGFHKNTVEYLWWSASAVDTPATKKNRLIFFA